MLKALMLRKKIDERNKQLQTLKDAAADFEKREAELAADIEEAAQATEEEQKVVEEAVDSFEAEKKQNAEEIKRLEGEIDELEKELKEAEAATNAATETPVEERAAVPERKEKRNMKTRMFDKLSVEQRSVIFESEKFVTFATEIRSAIAEKRALTNAGLTIPTELLEVLRWKVEEYSKLIRKVNLQRVGGTSRQIVPGTIPEAVWTEMCGNLNELALAFNDVELDGYKVGGYIPVCNAVLEDTDIDLVGTVLDAIAKGMGFALDKAIVYGSGTKMPLGIVTRLAQTSQPAGYPSTARTWVDLHTSNVKTGTGATGLNLIKEIIKNSAVADDKGYANNGMMWLMNHKTKTALLAEAVEVNAAGAIVAGLDAQMPIVGGEIIELSFIPDNNIVFGYGDLYVLAERAGFRLENSEHAMFVNDKTVFKGTARYDGQPSIAEAFGVLTIVNSAPTTSGITFASDSANP